MTEKSFTDRLLRMQPKMLNYALILTSNREDAYNLLQQTTLEALDHSGELPSSEGFDSWAHAVMRRVYNESEHTRHNAPHVALTLTERVGSDVPEHSLTPNEIGQRLDRLSGEARQAVEMWLTGYTREEISVKLHLSSKSVSVYIRQTKYLR